MICVYCSNEIPEGQEKEGPDGPACFNCCGDAVYAEPQVHLDSGENEIDECEHNEQSEEEMPNDGQSEEAQTILNLLNAMKELQFVRLRQIQSGETDHIILKRTLTEILLMMEEQLDIAKAMAIKLEPEAAIQSRFFMISALTYGLTYLSMHPVSQT